MFPNDRVITSGETIFTSDVLTKAESMPGTMKKVLNEKSDHHFWVTASAISLDISNTTLVPF